MQLVCKSRWHSKLITTYYVSLPQSIKMLRSSYMFQQTAEWYADVAILEHRSNDCRIRVLSLPAESTYLDCLAQTLHPPS
jgi:hypothetical protein